MGIDGFCSFIEIFLQIMNIVFCVMMRKGKEKWQRNADSTHDGS